MNSSHSQVPTDSLIYPTVRCQQLVGHYLRQRYQNPNVGLGQEIAQGRAEWTADLQYGSRPPKASLDGGFAPCG